MQMMPNPPPAIHVLTEKFVPSGLLNEVTVNNICDAALLQPSLCVIEAMNKTRAGKSDKAIAPRTLQSRDVLVTANTPSTKALLEQYKTWTTCIASSTRVQGHRSMIIAYTVRVSTIDRSEQAKYIFNNSSQYSFLKSRVIIVCIF
jgi:hypothetical protein